MVPRAKRLNDWARRRGLALHFLEEDAEAPAALYQRRLANGVVTLYEFHDYVDHAVGMLILARRADWQPLLATLRAAFAVQDSAPGVPPEILVRAEALSARVTTLIENLSTLYSERDRVGKSAALVERIQESEAAIPDLLRERGPLTAWLNEQAQRLGAPAPNGKSP